MTEEYGLHLEDYEEVYVPIYIIKHKYNNGMRYLNDPEEVSSYLWGKNLEDYFLYKLINF